MVPLFLIGRAIDGGSGATDVSALGFLAGITVGGLLGGVRVALTSVPSRWAFLLWTGAGAIGGLSTAKQLGAFAKLNSDHPVMAWLAIGAGLLFGMLVGALLAIAERATARSFSRRTAVAATLGYLCSVALTVVEPTVWVLRGYPAARTTLVLVAWLGATVAVDTAAAGLPIVRYRFATGLSLALLSLASVVRTFTLGPDDISLLLTASQTRRVIAAIRRATDFDGDGASSWLGGGDCAPFDPRIGPLAAEIPGNGIDDNCRYGDAKVLGGASPDAYPPPPTEPSPVNVLVVTIDALRPDHTTPYGFGRPTTPTLEHFARGAMRFDRAYTSGGWTALAIPSLLYGVYPRAMSWRLVALTKAGALIPFPWEGNIPPDDAFEISTTIPAAEPHPDLAFWLGRRGMRTTAVIPKKLFGFGFPQVVARNFASFHSGSVDRDDSVADLAIEEVGSTDPRPFFLWVHFFEPHEPTGDAPGAPDFGNALEDRYDRDVAYCDAQLGRLLRSVDALPSPRPTAVIVASDHGEEFRGGIQLHGEDLSLDAIRIVLIAKGPGLSAGVEGAPASLVDIAPTVLAWTKTPGPPGLDGQDLRSLPADRIVLTDLWRHDFSGTRFLDQTVAVSQTEMLTYDLLLQQKTLSRIDDREGRPMPAAASIPKSLDESLGAFLERARPVP